MKVIDERKERTTKRKLAKKRFDDIISLSAKYENTQTIRLLDEGAVVMEPDKPYCYIMKGTIEKALIDMPDDFVNYVDLGHLPFETFPISLGEVRKSDLHLVDIGNGRHGVDVDVRLDYSNPIVEALQRQPFDLAISARFFYEINDEKTKEVSELLGTYVEVIDKIEFVNYAIVGEPGNVNSDGLKLKGGVSVDIKALREALDKQGNEINLDTLSNAIDEVLGTPSEETEEVTEEVAEEATEEVAEEVAEEPVEPVAEEVAEEATEEPAEEPAAEEPVEEEPVAEPEEETVSNEEVLETIEQLNNRIAELEKENARLNQIVAENKAKEERFNARFKNLVVSTAEKEREVTINPAYTDGFGK